MITTDVNFKTTIETKSNLASVIERLTEELKKEGFGILTRIDFHEKMKEKLGKIMPPVVILGACHPETAFNAYQFSTDVTSLLPCNAVVRELKSHEYSIELAKPSSMLSALPKSKELDQMACEIDEKMTRIIARMESMH